MGRFREAAGEHCVCAPAKGRRGAVDQWKDPHSVRAQAVVSWGAELRPPVPGALVDVSPPGMDCDRRTALEAFETLKTVLKTHRLQRKV